MSKQTVKECLEAIGVTFEDLNTSSTLDEEFKIIKKLYHKRILIVHPDKGGNAEEFREVNVSFEVLKELYTKQKLTTFQSSLQSTQDSYQQNYKNFNHVPVPSWDTYAAAAEEAMPLFHMENAKSNRSKCNVYTKKNVRQNAMNEKSKEDSGRDIKISKARGCDGPSECIGKGEIRIGSFDPQSGGYGRWVHLCCWRVPSKLWLRIQECTTDEQVDIVLTTVNEVLLSGFTNLSVHDQVLVRQHVMNKDHWARLINRTTPEQTTTRPVPREDPIPVPSAEEIIEVAQPKHNSISSRLMSQHPPVPPKPAPVPPKPATTTPSNPTTNTVPPKPTAVPVKAAKTVPKPRSGPSGSHISNAVALVPNPPLQHSQAVIAVSSSHERFVVPVPGVNGARPHAMNGKTVVLTGIFPELGGGAGLDLGKERARAMVEAFGGRVTSAVSGKTDILLVGKEPGMSKVSKARSLPRCKLMSLADLKTGIEGPSLDAVAPMAPIQSFSGGYNRYGGSNSLALTATPMELAIAAGTMQVIEPAVMMMPQPRKRKAPAPRANRFKRIAYDF